MLINAYCEPRHVMRIRWCPHFQRAIVPADMPEIRASVVSPSISECVGLENDTRLLGIPGEDLPHVSHYPSDPHRYFRKRVLIVGGRNTAFETALRLFRVGAEVTLSYRRDNFDTGIPKRHLLAEVQMWMDEGRISFLPATVPVEITPEHVVLAPTSEGRTTEGNSIIHETDFVLLCTGFQADMRLFEMAGVELKGEAKKPTFDPQTMETNVPGVFVAGTANAGTQERFKAFIETSHVDVERITESLKARL